MTRLTRRAVVHGLIASGAAACVRIPKGTPRPVRRKFTARDGTRLSFLQLGHGRPVLLLHGFLANAQLNWFDTGLAQCLASRGVMVIAPDFRGHGQSGTSTAPYPGDVLATDQEDLLRHLRVRNYALGGYSLGSRMAVRMLVRGAQPQRLVLGGMGDSGIVAPGSRQALFEDLITNGANAANPKAGLFVQEMMKRHGVTAGQMLQVLAQQRPTTVEQLRRLTPPALLVSGLQDNDNGSPERLAAMLPHAKVLRVPGDHLSAVKTAELREAFCHELIR